jgi:predicted nucleic acid-binding Zn ribbon protein
VTDTEGSEGTSDLARAALARAKASSRAKPTRGAPPRRRPQYGDDRDPKTLDTVLQGWLRDHGYESQVGSGSLIARWPEIVGDQVADHVTPDSVQETDAGRELILRADSTAWATQVRILIPQIHGRIATLLGAGVVDRIKVMGPAPPKREMGSRRVPGRGPRDTYG